MESQTDKITVENGVDPVSQEDVKDMSRQELVKELEKRGLIVDPKEGVQRLRRRLTRVMLDEEETEENGGEHLDIRDKTVEGKSPKADSVNVMDLIRIMTLRDEERQRREDERRRREEEDRKANQDALLQAIFHLSQGRPQTLNRHNTEGADDYVDPEVNPEPREQRGREDQRGRNKARATLRAPPELEKNVTYKGFKRRIMQRQRT